MEKETIQNPPVNETELLKELEEWKEKADNAERDKASLLLLKLTVDESRRTLQDQQVELKALENQKALEHMTAQKEHQRQLLEVQESNRELSSEVQRLKKQVAEKKRKSEELRRPFLLRKTIPETKVKFTRLETTTHGDSDIVCCFRVSSKVPMKLNQGEALITFEEENVAQELIRRREHQVNLKNGKMTTLKAQPIALEKGVTFKLYTQISLEKIFVSNIPDLSIPEEWMRDKLELHFLRLGSGEVQDANYNRTSHTAWITFAQPQAAKDIVKYNDCPFHASGQAYRIQVTPCVDRMVKEFQMFSGVSRRTILLTGIAEVEAEDEELMQDLIAIHFQKPSNGGGEVEHIKCVSKGTKAAYFEMEGVI